MTRNSEKMSVALALKSAHAQTYTLLVFLISTRNKTYISTYFYNIRHLHFYYQDYSKGSGFLFSDLNLEFFNRDFLFSSQINNLNVDRCLGL